MQNFFLKIFLCLIFLSGSVQAQTCSWTEQIKYPDGTIGCLNDKNQQTKEVRSSYKLPLCKGGKKEWTDCYAQFFEDGQLLSEGDLINGKREGKWVFYPRIKTGIPHVDVPTVEEYANGMRIDGEYAEKSLRQMQKRKEADEKFERAFKNMGQNKLIIECVSSGGLIGDCKKNFENKFKE